MINAVDTIFVLSRSLELFQPAEAQLESISYLKVTNEVNKVENGDVSFLHRDFRDRGPIPEFGSRSLSKIPTWSL